jgi:hypothetical protein
MAISSSVSMQSAAKPGAMTSISPLCTSDTQMGLSCFSDDTIYNVMW